MSTGSGESLLLAIVGPTATGKSSLAIRAAQRLHGEIVNCDSMQLYRELDVGTAKPGLRERSLVPHHLYDRIYPGEVFSAGRYMKEARAICKQIADRGRVPIVTGGTGLYLRALLTGVFEGPGRSEELRDRLRAVARRRGPACLHRILGRRDPEAAARIPPKDLVRIVRALEVYLLTGKPISRLQEEQEPLTGFRIVKIGLNLPREILYDRIDRRVEQMFRNGILDEVRRLLKEGYDPQQKGFEALGYRHAAAVVEQKLSLEEAVELTKRDTRRYAKRQLTWFRREPELQWIPVPGEDPAALQWLDKFLENHGIRTGYRA